MRRTVYRMDLSPASIEGAIRAIRQELSYTERKAREVVARLAEEGLNVARFEFGAAFYQGINDAICDVEETPRGYRLVARGQCVYFIEFGAGVYYNEGKVYPAHKPSDVVGIGEYGKKQGKHEGWVYYDGDEKVFTHGNPAAMPMFTAQEHIKDVVNRIVREVFAS